MTWIRHQRSRRHLDGFVDEELRDARRVRVQRHLDECPDCAAHVRMVLAVRRSLYRLTNGDADAVGRMQARLTTFGPNGLDDADAAG